MDYARLKQTSLRAFIGFLALTALLSIVVVVRGTFGEIEWKTLLTTFTIAAASILCMACFAFIERHARWRRLGLGGAALAVVSALMLCLGVWIEVNEDVYWKVTATGIAFAAACAHAFLLLLPVLRDRYRWVQIANTATSLLLAALVALAVWAEISDDDYYKLIVVVSIVVVLWTVTIPILARLGAAEDAAPEAEIDAASTGPFGGRPDGSATLTLHHVEGDRYRDAAGRQYHVRPHDAPAPPEP